jgi:hypothetical protein
VFYVLDPADEKMHVVISGKQKIVGVENVGDQDEEYNKYEEMFVTPQVLHRVSTPGLPLLTHYYIKICMGKVPQTWNSRS